MHTRVHLSVFNVILVASEKRNIKMINSQISLHSWMQWHSACKCYKTHFASEWSHRMRANNHQERLLNCHVYVMTLQLHNSVIPYWCYDFSTNIETQCPHWQKSEVIIWYSDLIQGNLLLSLFPSCWKGGGEGTCISSVFVSFPLPGHFLSVWRARKGFRGKSMNKARQL